MSTRISFALVFALLALARTAPAAAQADAFSNRIAVYAGGGFAGQSSLHADRGSLSTTVDSDLDASAVAGLRFVDPFSRYFLIGADLRMIRWSDSSTSDRNTLIDFSVLPAARYVFDLGKLALEPYLGVPLGLTVNVLETDPNVGTGRGSVGFHVGVLGGLTALSRSGFGGFLELGWLHHQTFDKGDLDVKYRLVLNQMALHVGALYAF